MMLRIHFTFVLQLCAVFASGRKGELRTKGDILIGGLFPIHDVGSNGSKCTSFNSNPGYQYMEAMLYALDTINADPTILPGITLGSVIADTCSSEIIATRRTKKFIKIIFVPESTNNSELVSVVGPMYDQNTKLVANIVRVFHIPQISYGAMSKELSNKNNFKYFFRTIAPSFSFYKAMGAFLERMDWTYVALVYSHKIWTPHDTADFVDKMKHHDICVGRELHITPRTKDKHVHEYIEELVSNDKEPKIVILFTSTRDSRAMLAAKKRNPRGNMLTFVAGVTWSNRKIITQDYEDVGEGTFTFSHRQGSIPEFEKYFHSLRYNNYTRSNKYWIGEYWQETHQCNIPKLGIPTNFTKNCSGNENNAIYKEFAPVQLVINSVYAVANALDSLQKHFCPNITGICSKMRPISLLLEYIKNTTFQDALSHNTISFNSDQEVNTANYTIYNYRYINGTYDYIPVGFWSGITNNKRLTENLVLNESKIQSAHVNAAIPLFTCRPKCGRRQIRNQYKPGCCWKCQTCEKNEVVMNNTCVECVPGFRPGKNLSSCLKMDLIYINMDTPLAIVLAVFSGLGIIMDFVFLTAFFVCRNHSLIKASGREMCCIIFVGIATIFITSLTTLLKPTPGICSARRVFAGISFTICYAPLLMKVWRIYKIFQRANKLKRTSSRGIFGLAPMIGITFIIIIISVLYSVTISSIDPTVPVEKFYQDKQRLVFECTTNAAVFASIFAYNMILVLGCTLYAFLTRHFPKNFNEAMYIGMTLYLTCAVWVVFFANYLNSAYSISRVYWQSGSSILIGWITLLGLFAPKFYHVYTKPEVNREMLIRWSESTKQRSEDISGQCEECKRRAEMYSNGIGRTNASTRKHNDGSSDSPLSKTSSNGIGKRASFLIKQSNGIAKNDSFLSKQTNGIAKNDSFLSKQSNGIAKNDSFLSKQSNGIAKNDSFLSKQANGIAKNDSFLNKQSKNESSKTLQEVGINNLADTHL